MANVINSRHEMLKSSTKATMAMISDKLDKNYDPTGQNTIVQLDKP